MLGVFYFLKYLFYMKKIVRLTESDLVRIIKRIINEESAPCPPKQLTKAEVNTQLPLIKSEINRVFNEGIKSMEIQVKDEDTKDGIKNAYNEVFPFFVELKLNSLYSQFNIIKDFSQEKLYRKIIDTLYKYVYDEIEGSWTNRRLLDASVTSDNVERIKKEARTYTFLLFSMVLKIGNTDVEKEAIRRSQKCPDGSRRKLIEGSDGYFHVTNIMKEYFKKVEDLINSHV